MITATIRYYEETIARRKQLRCELHIEGLGQPYTKETTFNSAVDAERDARALSKLVGQSVRIVVVNLNGTRVER